MYYLITILNVNNSNAWKEPYNDFNKAAKRVKKLRYSSKLKIIDIDCSCTDDEQQLWSYYNNGY